GDGIEDENRAKSDHRGNGGGVEPAQALAHGGAEHLGALGVDRNELARETGEAQGLQDGAAGRGRPLARAHDGDAAGREEGSQVVARHSLNRTITGTWSEPWTQPRAGLKTSAPAISRTSAGVTQM